MIISLWGYAIQVSSLFFAVIIPVIEVQWCVGILGSIIAGFTSAIWWTAQGIYFEYISNEISKRLVLIPQDKGKYEVEALTGNGDEEEVSMIDQVRADLSADWTVIYQGADIVVFLAISLFTLSDHISTISMIGAMSIVGVITACLGNTFDDIDSAEDREPITVAEVKEAIYAVPKQYRDDARATLLAPFVFGFGISTAILAYYINDKVVSDHLSTELIGYFEAFSYLVAILAAYPYAFISNNLKSGQDLIIQFGSFCFLLTGISIMRYHDL